MSRRHRTSPPRKAKATGSPFAVVDQTFTLFESLVEKAARRGGALLHRLLAGLHRSVGIVLHCTMRVLGNLLSHVPWATRLAALFGILTFSAVRLSLETSSALFVDPGYSDKQLDLLTAANYPLMAAALESFSGLVAVLALLALLATLVRHRFSLHLMKVAAAGYAVVWGWYLSLLIRIPSHLYSTDFDTYDKGLRNEAWMLTVTPWFLMCGLPALALIVLSLRRVVETYCGASLQENPIGDRITENLATHGRDPRYRTSAYWSTFLHVAVLLVPVLMRGCGWEEPYAIPEGSGNPVVEVVKVRKPKKKRKMKYILAMDSPFIFERKDIDDEKVFEDVDAETAQQYAATSLQAKLGEGGGKSGGWPGGMPGRVRFIRLKYDGGDWDQDMGKNADYRFLVKFQELTGFKVADRTEYREIHRLSLFPKGKAPPFVFITGMKGIHLSQRETRKLRDYCLEEGGMIFADNGGGSFDTAFRSVARRIFPDKQWIDIPNDDMIYRQPFAFPNGAPPMMHHSGYRALGIKHHGRWVVFYHQGDLNDGWRKSEHISESAAMQAYKMGVNVMYYAFANYLARHNEQ